MTALAAIALRSSGPDRAPREARVAQDGRTPRDPDPGRGESRRGFRAELDDAARPGGGPPRRDASAKADPQVSTDADTDTDVAEATAYLTQLAGMAPRVVAPMVVSTAPLVIRIPALATAPVSAGSATAAATTPTATATAMAMATTTDAGAPRTPLEQAVLDLINHMEVSLDDESTELATGESSTEPIVAIEGAGRGAQAPAPTRPTAAIAVRAPQALPEAPSNPSHIHLVIDEGAERMVVTVAVRGADVNVAVRGGDDATAASLARNAATLDHAMRARGLDLSGFTAERELGHDQRKRGEADAQDRETHDEPFVLEELR